MCDRVRLETLINVTFQEMFEDIKKAEKGNKAAGVRARKKSLELADYLKQFRKESVNWD